MDSGVKDIFELEKEPANSRGTPSLMKDAIIGGMKAIIVFKRVYNRQVLICIQEPKKMKKTESMMKRPSGMNREVYALLYSDSKDS